jgi:hypothetical protein
VAEGEVVVVETEDVEEVVSAEVGLEVPRVVLAVDEDLQEVTLVVDLVVVSVDEVEVLIRYQTLHLMIS